MRNWILFSLAIALFTGCLDKCDEPDIDRINGLNFELKAGGPDGFSTEEIQSMYFVRYVPFSEPLLADTLYINGNYPEGFGKFIINDFFPFRNVGAPYYTVYGYLIVDDIDGYVVSIENIKLKGTYNGRCEYFNTGKSFFLNGDSIDWGGIEAPFVITR